MSLIDTIGTWVLENLPYERDNEKVRDALKVKSPMELLVIYLNWHGRLIVASSRQVLRSGAFDANPIAKERETAIGQIIGDIESGSPLTKYLSRGIRFGFALPPDPQKKQLNRRRELDLLLNDWGIHHLHISTEVGPDGFVKRGEPIIFAIFKPDRAYLIDIMKHGDWTNEQVVRTIIDSWPNDRLAHELKGIVGGGPCWSAQERAQLRGVGITTALSIDGRVYMPGAGISTAGTSPGTFMKARQVLNAVKSFEEQVEAKQDVIAEAIRQRGGQIHDELSFVFSVFEHGFGVVETNSGLQIILGQ
jgi:hypothetical protein